MLLVFLRGFQAIRISIKRVSQSEKIDLRFFFFLKISQNNGTRNLYDTNELYCNAKYNLYLTVIVSYRPRSDWEMSIRRL